MQSHPPIPAPAEPDGGLPVLPDLAARFTGAAEDTAPAPVGGGAALRDAAVGYWARRGVDATADRVLAAPGAQPLLLALFAAAGGDVLLSRPCAGWYEPLARLAGRPAYRAPVPAECGGVPDPFALLETVRRVRAEGGEPRVLVLSVADDPTGTVPPPELLHEVCEAAVAEGMLVVSDETWRDTVPEPHGTVLVSPAEMLPDRVVVLSDLAGALLPAGWPAAVARFPDTPDGAGLRSRALAMLAAVRGTLSAPVSAAAAYALDEPESVRSRAAAAAAAYRAVGAAAYRDLTGAGVLGLPPRAGRHLYADLSELRPALERRGVTDSVELADHLTRWLDMPVAGGHLFGDAPDALRARLPLAPLLGADERRRRTAAESPDPTELPYVRAALDRLAEVVTELSAARPG
ncbi:aminotransferase class I/II-fold pyridoxal phosphate-dependent enzyme [Streptomyces pactum]|uniref:Aminotransferase class I/II-fold pyridoxal phosphate-dependent enzyme n=1 Tax=Streptomyces pactum TaxID=68249 RepID=A0ABS0NRD9_9ACTN|nr:aminotransferase class I/II-fold pyridoxal phosphate-dependent enzyme [Streptomyces pactum]MBH5337737.1 aminotransferase class I/II-fold pyridoxal phosphate-dependent enzyme [Streptomyces pactum]